MSGWDGWAYDEKGELVPLPGREPDPRVVFWDIICSHPDAPHPQSGTRSRTLGLLADRRKTGWGDILGWQSPVGLSASDAQTLRADLTFGPQPELRLVLLRCRTCRRPFRLGMAKLSPLLDKLEAVRAADSPRVVNVAKDF